MSDEETMTDLGRLCAMCLSVSVDVNDHRVAYESVSGWLRDQGPHDADAATVAAMIERDIVVDVQAYPRTPVAYVRVLHHDVDEALRQVLEILGDE